MSLLVQIQVIMLNDNQKTFHKTVKIRCFEITLKIWKTIIDINISAIIPALSQYLQFRPKYRNHKSADSRHMPISSSTTALCIHSETSVYTPVWKISIRVYPRSIWSICNRHWMLLIGINPVRMGLWVGLVQLCPPWSFVKP